MKLMQKFEGVLKIIVYQLTSLIPPLEPTNIEQLYFPEFFLLSVKFKFSKVKQQIPNWAHKLKLVAQTW